MNRARRARQKANRARGRYGDPPLSQYIVLPRLGHGTASQGGGPWLPTIPATQVEFAGRWPARPWWRRALARLAWWRR